MPGPSTSRSSVGESIERSHTIHGWLVPRRTEDIPVAPNSKNVPGCGGVPTRLLESSVVIRERVDTAVIVYAFDVDETLEVSKGPVKLADLVKLREHGHVAGLCGNWSMVTLHCP